jgi:predicted RNA-binding protein with PUA-like domain
MNYWLVKSDPDTYGWKELVEEKSTAWTGVRNYAARIHLRAMKKGDVVLFYHSGEDRMVMGLSEVSKEAYADPTATEGDWVCVDLKAKQPFKNPVSLTEIKKEVSLKEIPLIRISRLSVMPMDKKAFDTIVKMGGGKS